MPAKLSLLSAASTLPLQFGIEIEVVVACPKIVFQQIPDQLLSEYLRRNGLSHTHGTDLSYTTWQLTRDGSVGASAPTVLSADDWEAQGIELISPPMPALMVNSQNAREPQQQERWHEASRYFSAICEFNGADPAHCDTAYTNPSCGFHMHFGLCNGANFPLPLLKQLAYLTLFYEDVFSSFHPRHRASYGDTQGARFAGSNRRAFCRCPLGTHSVYEPCANFDFSIARRRILAAENTGALAYLMGASKPLDDDLRPRHSTTKDLAPPPRRQYLPGQKYRVVRWDLLPPPEQLKGPNGYEMVRPQTVEFRQPTGTLDSREAAFTVQLYTAVIRAAERMARGEVSVHEKTPSLDGLLEVLGLGAVSKEYWLARAASMAQELETEELVFRKAPAWQAQQGPQRSSVSVNAGSGFPPLGETVTAASANIDTASTASPVRLCQARPGLGGRARWRRMSLGLVGGARA